MIKRIARLALLPLLAACAGGGPGTPSPAASALAYAMPAQASLTWIIGDTVAIAMNMGGQSVNVDAASRATVEVAFMQEGNATSATVRFTELDGRFGSSMGGTVTVSNADLPEPATIRFDRVGDIEITRMPEMTETVRQVLGTQSAFKRMFPPLPGRAVARGASWTDTTFIEDNNGDVQSTTTVVWTSTLAGDTTVNGRRLQIIRATGQVTGHVAGSSQGVEIQQSLSGTAESLMLWDPSLRAIYERREDGSLAGTMSLPAMGMSGIPVTYSGRQVMRLSTR